MKQGAYLKRQFNTPSKANLFLLIFLGMILCETVFLDYWAYSRTFHDDPNIVLDEIIAGTAPAPPQYRILIPFTAAFLAKHLHLGIRHILALIDLASALGASALLISLLRRQAFYRRGDQTFTVAVMLAALALAQFYLGWLTWYQKYETLSGVLYTCAMVWLFIAAAERRTYLYLSVAVLASLIESWSRADLVVVFNGGFLASMILFRKQLASLLTAWSVFACCAGAALGLLVQLYLSLILYPQATMGDVPVIQLFIYNLRIVPLAISLMFLLPAIFTIARILQTRKNAPNDGLLLVVPVVAYILLIFLAGSIEEVRLFFPIVFPLLPTTAVTVVLETTTA